MFTPPARKSMSDSELQNALGAAQADEAGILGAMELLERQSALREEDDRAFAQWSQRLTEIGTPEALHAIENGRRLIAGLEPLEFQVLSEQPELQRQEAPQNSAVEIDDAATQDESYDDAIAASLSALYSPANSAPVIPSYESNEVEEQLSIVSEPDPEPELESEPEPEHEAEPEPELESEPEPEPELATATTNDSLIVDSQEMQIRPDFDKLLSLPIDPQATGQALTAKTEKIKSSAINVKSRFELILPWLAINNVGFTVLLAFGVYTLASDTLSGLLGVFLGILAANVPIAAVVVAAKRSSRDATFVSRAAFGVFGNLVPGWVYLISRVTALAAAFAIVLHLISQGASSALSGSVESSIILSAALGVAVASVALGLSAKLRIATNAIGTAISVALALAIAVSFAPLFNFANISFAKSQNSNLVEIAALVFALIVSVWVPSAADAPAKLSKSTRAIQALATTSLGTFVAPLVLTTFFLLVFAGAKVTWSAQLKSGLLSALSAVSPFAFWLLVSAILVSALLWTSNFVASLQGMLSGLIAKKMSLISSIVVVVVLVLATFGISNMTISPNLFGSVLGLFELAAIPALAWAGIFTSDVFLRRVAYHEVSLTRSYGFYKPLNFANLIGWTISTAVGVAFLQSTSSNIASSGLVGFANLFAPEFVQAVEDSGLLLFIVYVSAALFPIAVGIPRIKEQEREALALEARRDDLKDIFKFGE